MQIVAERGQPQAIRCDNGPELTSRHFLAWCVERQIELVHIQPGKPTQNARVESFHGRLRDECLTVSWFQNLFDARRKIAAWQNGVQRRASAQQLGIQNPEGVCERRPRASTQLSEGQGTQTPSLAPRAPPSRLKPEMEQQKVVVFLRERKQGAGQADGHVATIDTNTITYDANGNKVEENVGGTIHEYVSAFGVTAQMTGTAENATNVDLPGGVQAIYSGGMLKRFRYPDWQGTIRAESNSSTRVFTESLAFAPFGERYAVMGAPFNVDSFTGKPDQIVSDEYDFPAREEHGGQGRWISPDPMRGTGNKYVYADNNPLSKVDVYGLYSILVNGLEVGYQEGLVFPFDTAESHPPQSSQTGGQTTTQPSSGNSSSSSTQTPADQQSAQAKRATSRANRYSNPKSSLSGRSF